MRFSEPTGGFAPERHPKTVDKSTHAAATAGGGRSACPPWRRGVRGWLLLAAMLMAVPLALTTAALTARLGAEGAPLLAPPRTAVVDISTVFENYRKRKDRQAQLQTELTKVTEELKEYQQKYEELQAELKLIQPDSDLHAEKRLEMKRLELDVELLRDKRAKALKDTMRDFLGEIRDEITREIEEFATAHDIDLVLEKTVTVEGNPGGPAFRWPIVHFSRKEFDVTEEITKRLNQKYRP